MKPSYENILIRRVSNGWLVIRSTETSSESFVYEDTEVGNWVSESLYNLLCDQFECYMQSKRTSGIKISFSHKTREEEEENEDD